MSWLGRLCLGILVGVSCGWFGADTDWDTDRVFWRGFGQITGDRPKGGNQSERPRNAGLKVVPKGGVEPPCPRGARDFESRASASSATSASISAARQKQIEGSLKVGGCQGPRAVVGGRWPV